MQSSLTAKCLCRLGGKFDPRQTHSCVNVVATCFVSGMAGHEWNLRLCHVRLRVQQSRAVEACRARNPEVRRWKLRSAKCFIVVWHIWRPYLDWLMLCSGSFAGDGKCTSYSRANFQKSYAPDEGLEPATLRLKV